MSEPHEVTIEELQRAVKKRWESWRSETYVAYQRSPRAKATAEAVYPLLLEHAAWAVRQAQLDRDGDPYVHLVQNGGAVHAFIDPLDPSRQWTEDPAKVTCGTCVAIREER